MEYVLAQLDAVTNVEQVDMSDRIPPANWRVAPACSWH